MKNIYRIVLLSVFACSLTAQAQIDLKYNLELNKVYKVKNYTTQNTTQTVQGNQTSVQTNVTIVFSMKPLKNIENGLISEVRLDTIITKISMPQMEINSANPGDIKSSDMGKVMECIMNRLCNSTFVVKLANSGQVLAIMNIEQATSAILQDIDSIQGPMAEMLKVRAKMMVEEGAIKTMIESVTNFLPGKVVNKGDSWITNQVFSSGGMDMTANATYKLRAVEKNSANVVGDMVIESGKKPMNMNGAEITPDIRGIGISELTVDVATGWIISGTNKLQLKGELGVNAPGTSLQIPVEITSESEMIAIP